VFYSVALKQKNKFLNVCFERNINYTWIWGNKHRRSQDFVWRCTFSTTFLAVDNKILSYRRKTALQGALVLAKSGRFELGYGMDTIGLSHTTVTYNRSAKLSNLVVLFVALPHSAQPMQSTATTSVNSLDISTNADFLVSYW